jgi:hypothetical protein
MHDLVPRTCHYEWHEAVISGCSRSLETGYDQAFRE